ncbi:MULTISPECIES: hypothetical protein [unclassified Sphingomonas]|uniref:hypothetical protein n=1 Tax=unclassified Sphingomonas TaxID=196159 RepID=UPI00226A97EE|nr:MULTISPECIES: hypothetical protein [unclassified Sphingomonas]
MTAPRNNAAGDGYLQPLDQPDSHIMGKIKHASSKAADRQRARASLMITRHAGMSAEAEWTATGMLSIAVLVSSILLSTAVIVRAARTPRR